ncbi:MAG: proton-conducting transporter membrane subunit [Methanobacteriaceae archaeon]
MEIHYPFFIITTPSSFFCCLSITTRVIIITSTPSFFIRWIVLEINTLTFIPLILFFNKKTSGEIALKYFLSQTLASIFFAFAILSPFMFNRNIIEFIIFNALALKIAVAPFHA